MTPREKNLSDIGLIALRHGLTRHDILGRSRDPKIVLARKQCAAHFAGMNKGLSEIGRIMRRDHSSIAYYLNGKKSRKQRMAER